MDKSGVLEVCHSTLLITLESCKEINEVYKTSKWNLLFWHLTKSTRLLFRHRGNQFTLYSVMGTLCIDMERKPTQAEGGT